MGVLPGPEREQVTEESCSRWVTVKSARTSLSTTDGVLLVNMSAGRAAGGTSTVRVQEI